MVDARGYLCPMPVVMVQKALEAEHPDTLEVLVDNETAVENIKRFAAHSGYQATAVEDGEDYRLTLKKERNAEGTYLLVRPFSRLCWIRVPSRRSRPGRA